MEPLRCDLCSSTEDVKIYGLGGNQPEFFCAEHYPKAIKGTNYESGYRAVEVQGRHEAMEAGRTWVQGVCENIREAAADAYPDQPYLQYLFCIMAGQQVGNVGRDLAQVGNAYPYAKAKDTEGKDRKVDDGGVGETPTR